MFSRNVLKEELKNVKNMLKRYTDEYYKKYSWGISIKQIGRNKYLYRMKRINGEVIYKYCGKLNNKIIEEIKNEREEKAVLKKNIKKLKIEMRYLEKSLRIKND